MAGNSRGSPEGGVVGLGDAHRGWPLSHQVSHGAARHYMRCGALQASTSFKLCRDLDESFTAWVKT